MTLILLCNQTASHQVQVMMVQALASWCYQTDPSDLMRMACILEAAKDLKVIMITDQFLFVNELAMFAAKRGFLNLDKWITDKMKAHQVGVQCGLNVQYSI